MRDSDIEIILLWYAEHQQNHPITLAESELVLKLKELRGQASTHIQDAIFYVNKETKLDGP